VGRAPENGPVPRVALLLLGALLLAGPASASAADSAYLAELQEAARKRGLADRREWDVLVHYRRSTLTRSRTSDADSDEFFLAADGKTNPEAELEATLTAFFAPSDEMIRLGDHPQCAYPARREWLDRELEFDRERMPWQACPAFDEWIEALQPAGLTLVFAEAFMNNPSSTFGHTLLRVDQAAPAGGGARQDLLAYSVNFAGESGADTGALYAVKGVVGLYDGFFSLLPYYDKINQYVRWESRDLWEYPLAFSRTEVVRLLMHLWELRDIGFAYYFFSENCSYQLLGLLEAARPGLDLSARLGWVMPIDTVRDILREAGLAGDARWRPSAITRIRHLAQSLDSEQRALARSISEGTVAPDSEIVTSLEPETRALVLSVAHDRLAYEIHAGDAEGRKRVIAILRQRALTRVKGDPAPPAARPQASPDEGHGSSRVRVAGGAVDGRSYVELRWRPAFHDLLDDQRGFLEGAQIELLDIALRYHPEDGDFDVHEVKLIEIRSLAPRDELFDPISWKLRTGMATRRMPSSVVDDLRESKLWRSHGGAGLSARPWKNILAYAFLDGTFDVSGKLEDGYALGAGASVGLYLGHDEDRWRGHLFARATRFFAGDTRTALQVGLEQRLRLTRSHALRLHVVGERDFHDDWLDVGLAWDFYF
jgi:hypothetical protein